jgi:hypothetical protein
LQKQEEVISKFENTSSLENYKNEKEKIYVEENESTHNNDIGNQRIDLYFPF